MARYLLVSSGYPSKYDKYNCTFVHTRAVEYKKRGLNVDVLYVNSRPFNSLRRTGLKEYSYEGVNVLKGQTRDVLQVLQNNSYDKILIHFAYPRTISAVLKNTTGVPVIIWSHGVDIISWRRRLYNLRLANSVKFVAYAIFNIARRLKLAVLIRKYNDTLSFVFVSNWLKSTAQKDLYSEGRIKSYVIPNPINCTLFSYEQKHAENRLNFISVRSYQSRNYANDLTVKAILKLSKKTYFSKLNFTICGKGRLWDKTVKPLRQLNNVRLENRFFSHTELKDLYNQHGVILMPSRQDTHGISTCEGMSSGLVAISSNNSAIPEYVPKSCGYLTDDYQGIISAIEDIYHHPNKFLEFSKKCADYIRKKCSSDIITDLEIVLIEGDSR